MAANNITETMSITHSLVAIAPAFASGSKTVSVVGTRISQLGSRVASGIQAVTSAAAAIDLGALTGAVLGRYGIRNLDGTNNLTILISSSGAAMDTLLPGEMKMGRFDASITAPAAKSSAGTVLMEYLICEG